MTTETVWGGTPIFEVSSAAPDADPVWVDFSDRVIVPEGETLETWLGRATELDTPEPSKIKLKLKNRDRALTPGNTTSIYYPWWKQARRCRFREQFGYVAYDHWDGFLEIPENVIDMDVTGDTEADMELNVSGIDLLGRYQNGRRFISTLAEHILYNGGTALKAYYPMGEATAPFRDATNQQPPLAYGNSSNPAFLGPTLPILFQNGTLAADDLSVARFQYNFDGANLSGDTRLMSTWTSGPTLSAGQVLTLVAWVNPTFYGTGDYFWTPIRVDMTETPAASSVARVSGGGTGTWTAATTGGAVGSQTATGNLAPSSKAYPVAVRYGFNSDVLELWVGTDQTVNSTFSGSDPTSALITTLYAPSSRYQGLLGHVQVYVGAPGDFDRTAFLAQYQMGLLGLEGQTTSQRVNTILDYAGFSAYRRDIESGSGVMTRATLAGNTAATELERARATEQGRLFMAAGRVQFHGRRHLYDI